MLGAAGLGELAFAEVADYSRALITLAQQPELAAGYKRLLNEQRLTLPLFDSQRYTGEFEHLLTRMWQRWAAGEAPDHLLAR